MRAPALRAASARIGALRAAFLVLFLVLAARAAHLTVVDDRGAGVGGRQVHTTLRLPPSRGMILDRDGVELAVSVTAPSIYVLRSEISDVRSTARALGRVLGLDADRLAGRLRGPANFTFVSRWVEQEQADRIEALELEGVGIVRESRRAYPARELSASLLGFANIDGEGVRGIEELEDPWLRGSPQIAPVERDGSGRLLAREMLTPGDAAGGDVLLTLDSKMQASAEHALLEAIERTGAKGGTVVTLDPRTGDLLALAEAPTFDPNRFRETSYDETRARAFTDAMEPGSTFKVFLAAAALESGTMTASDLLDCSGGEMRVPGKTIRDHDDYGMLDLAGMLRVSSNVGAVQVAQRLGAEAHHAALLRFGFGKVTGSGFPVESPGILRPWKKWRPVDHATVAFGQGLGVTPVQLAAATAALAYDGMLRTPRLVAARRMAGGRWEKVEAQTPRRAVSAQTAGTVLEMMEGVVSADGTAELAALEGVRVAGKTGTAQKLDRETGTYSQDQFIAWFIAAAPADDPQLVWVVALDEPRRGMHHGGTAAGPLFAEVATAQLSRRGILTQPMEHDASAGEVEIRVAAAPVRNPEPTAGVIPESNIDPAPPATPVRTVTSVSAPTPSPNPAPVRTEPSIPPPPVASAPVDRAAVEVVSIGGRVLLPDFRGMSMQEVMEITSENALELQFRGRGHVVEQYPGPGTILDGADRRVFVRFAAGNEMGEG